MASTRKYKLLALHGKGTSARIMKTQLKPIIDVLGDILEIHYMDGGEVSAPYQGIESMFPKESFYAWYEKPTRVALQAAHDRVAQRLALRPGSICKQQQGSSFDVATDLGSNVLGVLTPPEIPTSATRASPTFSMPLCMSSILQQQHIGDLGNLNVPRQAGAHRTFSHLITGLDTPDSYPSTAGPRTPMDIGCDSYDGLICFSQGCAVATGLLLNELATKNVGCEKLLPVRFVILICGGRPFDREGTMQRVDPMSVASIAVPSIHVHGRADPGLEESRRLAAFYSDSEKQVVELSVGHCPPRRTSDVGVLTDAIRRMVLKLD
ncbi:uncharacterized protein MEPE_06812 [Melanopsichium pennsylvanicum]|uniref:Serine hydrolase domain-containing protein n=2 Tax=Melanopsichium pennsylvanicum TaxID=63383 RepID=A0AAJ4XTY0_9BASI|nr:conserved hypothetical protein [Melanopsichium pennsylvanicum 4]SNX88101.1 uncharacterized protein MEPE_06812 [Melanopsichium pennsylvanicum]